jgi:hypothetical protein
LRKLLVVDHLNWTEKASAFPQVAAGFFKIGVDTMESNNGKYMTDYQSVTVKLGDGTILNGKVNVSPEGRTSDIFTSKEKTFVILVESDSVERSYDTIVVNKKEVVWVEPEDTPAV